MCLNAVHCFDNLLTEDARSFVLKRDRKMLTLHTILLVISIYNVGHLSFMTFDLSLSTGIAFGYFNIFLKFISIIHI